MNVNQAGEERLATMLGVVPLGKVAVDPQQLERHKVQAPSLEACDHRADEATLHAVRLDEDQGSFDAHGAKV